MKRPAVIHTLLAVWQVAAVYVYFLLFDQFGFLHHLHLVNLSPMEVQWVMTAMGAAGLAGSIMVARRVRSGGLRGRLTVAWLACAAAAPASLLSDRFIPLLLEGLLIGVTTGAITVLVAASLRELMHDGHLGLGVGLGTGIAYGAANLPVLFDSSLTVIAFLSAFLSLTAGLMIHRFLPALSAEDVPPEIEVNRRDRFWPWIVGLGLLVCLDSGAFAMIQQDEILKSWTWGPSSHKLWLGVTHASAAIIAGFLIDRGFRYTLAAATWILFAIAFQVIPGGMPDAYPASLIYAAGISTYSVALVAVPSLLGGQLPVRAMRAAWLFGVSGWVGSALGIGMAQHHDWVPGWFIYASGAVLLAAGLFAFVRFTRSAVRTFGPAIAALTGIAGWLAISPGPESAVETEMSGREAEISRGADVYRREGCINCHSQYVRPTGPDVDLWGPYSPIDRTEQPPMVGNRRQGPDLKNAGLRRSPAWHRVHLIDPRAVSPGSRMPSYAHLFEGDGRDGRDLVAYLSDRGSGMREAYMARIMAWQPADLTAGKADRGARLFAFHCAVCHGDRARGDGPTAASFTPRPRDLATSAYIMSEPDREGDPLSIALSRIVKYGLPGTSMPGHEVLSDRDVADLVHFIASLGPEKAEEALP